MNLWFISNFENFWKKYFLYLFDRNYKILETPQNHTFGTEFMYRFLFLFELITYTWYFCYLFSFLLFFLFLRLFLFFKSNIHTKCGTWSHLRKGPCKIISGQKYEFVMYFKFRDFLKKKNIYLFDRNYKIL